MTTFVQDKADELRTMPKRLTRAELAKFGMPIAGEGRIFQIESVDGRFAFLIDVNRRGKIKLTRCSYQERYRVTDILARLDINGPPHTNPSVTPPPLPSLAAYVGATIACPHFHYYVEGFGIRWAVPAAEMGFNDTHDLVGALREFMAHCGVQNVPKIQYPMF